MFQKYVLISRVRTRNLKSSNSLCVLNGICVNTDIHSSRTFRKESNPYDYVGCTFFGSIHGEAVVSNILISHRIYLHMYSGKSLFSQKLLVAIQDQLAEDVRLSQQAHGGSSVSFWNVGTKFLPRLHIK